MKIIMKRLFNLFGIVGAILILGAAGMADTYNGEHMFSTLLAGVFFVAAGVVCSYYYKLHCESKAISRRIKKLRAEI